MTQSGQLWMPHNRLVQYMRRIVALLFLVVPIAGLTQANNPIDTGRERSAVDIESDMVAIESLWSSLKTALIIGDVEAAGAHFAPYRRDRYKRQFERMGPQMSKVPSKWRKFTPLEVGTDLATYAFIQEESSGHRTHIVTFVRLPEFGWLIQDY